MSALRTCRSIAARGFASLAPRPPAARCPARLLARPVGHTGGHARKRPGRDSGPPAFTLIEVLLALALAVLLLSAVGMAISVHFRAQSAGRAQVEEAQLARTLLELIASDLRRVIPYDPQQEKRYQIAWPSTSGRSGGARGASGLAAAAPSAGLEGLEDEAAELAEAAEDLGGDAASQALLAGEAGLYGDAWGLQLDISRLPRIDALLAAWQLADAAQATDSLALAGTGSDLKTVIYYVAGNTALRAETLAAGQPSAVSATSAISPGELIPATGGLVRREMDRQSAVFAAEQGLLAAGEQTDDVVAPEVVALQFRYFDGVEWLDEWDSEVQGGLPVAVEIGLCLRRAEASAETGLPPAALYPLDADASSLGKGYAVYRLTVDLPAAVPTASALASATGQAEATGQSEATSESGEESQGSTQPAAGQPSGGRSSADGSGASPSGPGAAPPGGPDAGGGSQGGGGAPPVGPSPGPGAEQDDRSQRAPG